MKNQKLGNSQKRKRETPRQIGQQTMKNQKSGTSQKRKREMPRRMPISSSSSDTSQTSVESSLPKQESDDSDINQGTSHMSHRKQCNKPRVQMPKQESDDSDINQGTSHMSHRKQCNKPPNLPFVKTILHLWEIMESMECFKQMPQNPHFAPLRREVKEKREGLALGYMITFSNVAERASKLEPKDPKSISDGILENLKELEKHGFDVWDVRERVNEVAILKSRQEKLLEELRELNEQIADRKVEKGKIDEEITELQEKIGKVKTRNRRGEKTELEEELQSAVSAREKADRETAVLKLQLRKVKKTCKDWSLI